ncbi:MAG: AraC family transcriptional regulator [Rhizobiales bacterium]|nr:AraC family transcriptional regulator [Hyphomicrobiales bacterium]
MILPPYAYLTQIRIDKSRQLLQQCAPVSQVALGVDFADQAHFAKRFKQLTGTTPARYAKYFQRRRCRSDVFQCCLEFADEKFWVFQPD